MNKHHYQGRPIQEDNRLHGVIVACQRDNGDWLVIRRALTLKAAPGKIGFPGGGVEIGEGYAEAARREFLEEVGCEVEIVSQVWEYAFEEKPLTLFGFYGRLKTLEFSPDPAEVDDCLWFDSQAIRSHEDMLPKSGLFLDALEGYLRGEG